MHRGTIAVLCNLGVSERVFLAPPESKVLLASRAMPQNIGGEVALPPDTIAVLTSPAPFLSSHQP